MYQGLKQLIIALFKRPHVTNHNFFPYAYLALQMRVMGMEFDQDLWRGKLQILLITIQGCLLGDRFSHLHATDERDGQTQTRINTTAYTAL